MIASETVTAAVTVVGMAKAAMLITTAAAEATAAGTTVAGTTVAASAAVLMASAAVLMASAAVLMSMLMALATVAASYQSSNKGLGAAKAVKRDV